MIIPVTVVKQVSVRSKLCPQKLCFKASDLKGKDWNYYCETRAEGHCPLKNLTESNIKFVYQV